MTRSADRRALQGLVAALLLVLLAACGSPEQREARHVARGIELLEQRDAAKAMIEFRNALRINPKNADALYHVGVLHEQAQRWPQAFAAFQAAAAERPGFPAANLKIGTLALLSGELELADRAARSILDHRPDEPDGLTLEAAVLLRRGDLARAERIAGEIRAAEPGHEGAIAVLVGVLSARERGAEAVALLDQAIGGRADAVALRQLRIALLERLGEVGAVVAAYGELVQSDPGNARHRLALADFHRQRDEFRAAEAVLRSAIDSGVGTDQMGPALVELVQREHGIEAAEREALRLLERAPGNHALRFTLAELLARERRFERAQAVLDEVLAASGGSGALGEDAKAAKAQLWLVAGDPAAARTLAEEVVAANGEHRGGNLLRGVLQLGDGAHDEAIRSARTALRRDPAWLPGLRLLAEAHLRKGETNLAVDVLNAIVTLAPSDAGAAQTLGQLLTARGDYDAALKVWDQALRGGGEAGLALGARAEIQIRQRNWAAAQSDIGRLLETPGQEARGALLAGDLWLARQRPEEGRSWFERAALTAPDAAEPMIGIVRSHLAAGDLDGALRFLATRTGERPEDAVAFSVLGDILLRAGRTAEAETALRRAIELQPDWLQPYRQLAASQRARGATDPALATYAAALARVPDEPGLLMELAATKLAAGREAEAIEVYGRVIAVEPGNEIAINNYAALVADHRAEGEDLDRALALAQRFRTSSNAWFLDTLGWLYFQKGDYPVAATFLDRAVSHAPDEPLFRFHLGQALYRAGQKERARLELERAAADEGFAESDAARTLLVMLEAELERAPAAAAPGG